MKKAIVSGIFLSLTITLCCCRHSTTHNRDEYITDYTSFTDYEYIYDNNGLLKKVIERSDNIAFLSNDFIVSETVYFYDERDSIHKTEYYTYFSTK
ncbi:MAG: hypothetical protein LIP01_14475 [Tannerellaceae bacterium]|nr:hypothetical protein [Tannerellaceae bacterium]